MSWLDDLKNKASSYKPSVKVGSIPYLPIDIGVSEQLGVGNAIKSAYSKYNSGGNTGGQVLGSGTVTSTPTNANQNVPVPNGFYDRNTGGTGGQPTGDNTVQRLGDNANEGKNSAIDAIKSRLSMIRDVANRQIGVAGGIRDELKSNIASTYGGLKTSAEQKVGTILDTLGQERTGVYDTYGTAKGESRRALESAMLKNRVLARAMGRTDSSFYDDSQAQATETGARNIGGLAREEAGKVAGIGTRETETKNWGEQTVLGIEQEQASLTSQADQEYQQTVSEAMDMEKAFGIDSEEQLRNAEIQYQSKLDGISQYIENKGMRVAEIMAQAGVLGSGINDFTALNPDLQGILTNNSNLNKAQTTEIPTMATVTSGNENLANVTQNQNTSLLDEIYKRLGLNLASSGGSW